MEPANLNLPPDRGDDRLDALLRAPASTLPDDGFSARVLDALPPAAIRHSVRTRRSYFALAAAAAALGTLAVLTISAPWAELQTAFAPVSVSLSDPSVFAVLVVALGSTVYALWPALTKRTA